MINCYHIFYFLFKKYDYFGIINKGDTMELGELLSIYMDYKTTIDKLWRSL